MQKLEWVLQVTGAIESKGTVLRDADAWILGKYWDCPNYLAAGRISRTKIPQKMKTE